MSDRDLLEEIFETAHDPQLKVTAIRDKICSTLAEAGFTDDTGQDDDAEDEEDDN